MLHGVGVADAKGNLEAGGPGFKVWAMAKRAPVGGWHEDRMDRFNRNNRISRKRDKDDDEEGTGRKLIKVKAKPRSGGKPIGSAAVAPAGGQQRQHYQSSSFDERSRASRYTPVAESSKARSVSENHRGNDLRYDYDYKRCREPKHEGNRSPNRHYHQLSTSRSGPKSTGRRPADDIEEIIRSTQYLTTDDARSRMMSTRSQRRPSTREAYPMPGFEIHSSRETRPSSNNIGYGHNDRASRSSSRYRSDDRGPRSYSSRGSRDDSVSRSYSSRDDGNDRGGSSSKMSKSHSSSPDKGKGRQISPKGAKLARSIFRQ